MEHFSYLKQFERVQTNQSQNLQKTPKILLGFPKIVFLKLPSLLNYLYLNSQKILLKEGRLFSLQEYLEYNIFEFVEPVLQQMLFYLPQAQQIIPAEKINIKPVNSTVLLLIE